MVTLLQIVFVCTFLGTVCSEAFDLKWTPPRYNKTVWTAFRSKEFLTPFGNMTSNPYEDAHFNTTRSGVCGVLYSDDSRKSYSLKTFPDAHSLQAAGAFLTHLGGCNLCSTLQDLSVYMEHFNLTAPVRKCGVTGFVSKKKNIEWKTNENNCYNKALYHYNCNGKFGYST